MAGYGWQLHYILGPSTPLVFLYTSPSIFKRLYMLFFVMVWKPNKYNFNYRRWPTLAFTLSHLFSSLNLHENFVNLFLWGYNLHMSSVSLLIPLLWAIQISPVTFSLIILSPVIVLPNCVERDSKNVIYCDCLLLVATLKVAQQFLL